MSGLSNLLPADADLVAGLPYRVGIWIAALDPEGGTGTQPQEIDALEHVLKDAATRHDVTGSIARETLKRENQWPAWRQAAASAPADCARARTFLKSVLTPEDLHLYCKWLFGIAVAVAEAYGEFSSGEDHMGAVGHVMNRMTGFVTGHIPLAHPDRVSPREMAALEKFRCVLDV